MTSLIAALYVAGALCEVGGVGLVVRQYRRARRLWAEYSRAVAEDQQLIETDPRYHLDPLLSEYGFTADEVKRSSEALEALINPDQSDQIFTVLLLIGGILVGGCANLIALWR